MKNSINTYALILIVSLLSIACENDCIVPEDSINKEYYNDEIFNETYIDIYGNWALTDVTGGIHGSGHELNFDRLQISKFGIYAFIEDDMVLEYGKIVIDEQTDDLLRIIFTPDEDSEVFMFDSEKNVILLGSDSLVLQSPCCDRYNYHFVRE